MNNNRTEDASDPEEISKSQRKRDADAIRALGLEISELGESERATVPLPESVRDAIEELIRIRAHSAKKRQLGLVAKRMRDIDLEPVIEAVNKIRLAARMSTQLHHRIENWRDRLLGKIATEDAGDALTAFINEYPLANRQLLRQLQRQALQKRESSHAPRQARMLFREVRDCVLASAGTDPEANSDNPE